MAKPDDAACACEVLRRSISECCVEDHRNDASVLAAWLGNKTPENVASWFSSPAHFSLVAQADGEIAGVGMLTRAGKIVLFYVSPAARFTGVGKALLQAIETHALASGLGSLQVMSTFTARPFYLRHGFTEAGSATSAFGSEVVSMAKKLHASGHVKKGGCRCSSA